MPAPTSPYPPTLSTRWSIALAGAVSLAVAMGIGRFAFTPLLPMMLADGVVDLATASWLASANYLGYLAGALLCTFQPWIWARLPGLPAVDGPRVVRGGLVATAVLTLAMALPWPALWPLLRFAAGVASALVFIYTSGWCLAALARRGDAALGGAMYTGPGAGIVVSGLFASVMVAWHWRAASGWLVFGAMALVLLASVWRTIRSEPSADAATATTAAATGGSEGGAPANTAEVACLTAAYGLAGFGYIITATFLPVIARAALPGSPWLDFFWPLFGLGVIAGALLATRVRIAGDLRRTLAGCYFVQAAGVALSLGWPTLGGFALGSLLLGLPFTAITFFAMQEVRRLRPATAASTMGLLTAFYGIGQIAGPPLAAALLHRAGEAGRGFTLSLSIAATALVAGALLYLWMGRAFPKR
ncbi:MAG: YbfB/YjiJ family MFS transporter [Burkholderiales bacterium]